MNAHQRRTAMRRIRQLLHGKEPSFANFVATTRNPFRGLTHNPRKKP